MSPPDKLINFSSVKYFNTETKIDTGIATFIMSLDKSLPKSLWNKPFTCKKYPSTISAIIGTMDSRDVKNNINIAS